MLPPLHTFKVFESVTRLGSLVAAAVELHVTVGEVSQQVKALQASLGVELFEKRGRQRVLTARGPEIRALIDWLLSTAGQPDQLENMFSR